LYGKEIISTDRYSDIIENAYKEMHTQPKPEGRRSLDEESRAGLEVSFQVAGEFAK